MTDWYVCLDCREKFEEPKTITEKIGEFWGAPAYETTGYCPCCGSPDYVENMGTIHYNDEDEEEDEE